MINKVRLPLRAKFTVLIGLLLLGSLSLYLLYVLKIFEEDKSADIYSMALKNATVNADKIQSSLIQEIQIFEQFNFFEEIPMIKLESLFLTHPFIFGIQCRDHDNRVYSFENVGLLNMLDGPVKLDNSFALNAEWSYADDEVKVLRGKITKYPPHFTLMKSFKNEGICFLHISFEKIVSLISDESRYSSFFLTDTGTVFYNLRPNHKIFNPIKIISDKSIEVGNKGVRKYLTEDNRNVILAFSKIANTNLISFSEIDEKQAFVASSLLIQKTFYFGFVVLSISAIVGILFTRRMTKDLTTLYDANLELSKGNFDFNFNISSTDEIGILSRSFSEMKSKILVLMNEMKEKARIESEVHLAKIVQNSFFEKYPFKSNGLCVDGGYFPASECSGDWWGILEQSDRVSVIICDTTGHGISAALITSAAFSCINSMKTEIKTRYFSPSVILERLNKVICGLNANLQMTAFVVEYNNKEKQIIYSNASHLPGLLIRSSKGVSKDFIYPLNENNGPRLGETWNASFSNNMEKIDSGDFVFMYTDGILAHWSRKYKRSQNYLIKLILEFLQRGRNDFGKGLLDVLKNDLQKEVIEDDITFINLSFENTFLEVSDFVQARKILSEQVDKRNTIGKSVLSTLESEENLKLIMCYDNLLSIYSKDSLSLSLEMSFLDFLTYQSSHWKVFFKQLKYDSQLIFNSKNIDSSIKLLLNKFRANDFNFFYEENIYLVCNELLSNAFYYSSPKEVFERGAEIKLEEGDAVNFEIGETHEYFIIVVSGPTHLPPKVEIAKKILRVYDEKHPEMEKKGAGLGFYMIFQNCSQMIINNQSNGRGEVICIIEKFDRKKQLKGRSTSFHYIDHRIED